MGSKVLHFYDNFFNLWSLTVIINMISKTVYCCYTDSAWIKDHCFQVVPLSSSAL